MTTSHHLFTVSYFIESGCLGAQGAQRIDGFCEFVTIKLKQSFPAFCSWNIKPLIDNQQRHIQYTLNQKTLTLEQAKRYLDTQHQDINSFENNVDDFVIDSIEEYQGR